VSLRRIAAETRRPLRRRSGFICVTARPAGFRYGKLRPTAACGLDLICLKNETRVDAERDLRRLISAAGVDVTEKTRRERLLRHLESADKRPGWNGLGTAHHTDSRDSFTVFYRDVGC
jgi:hypothetical protein